MKEPKLSTYKYIGKKGYNLPNIHAWVGNSQGDHFCTNNIQEGLAQGPWASYMFHDIDPTDQEAINAESARRKALNDAYVKELKEIGEYGKPAEPIEITLVHNPMFDDPIKPNKSLESYRFIILNTNDEA